MGEYIGRINIPKDIMLHVVNDIFNKNIKESTTKENILKIIPEIYTEDNFLDLIKMLPYESYLTLEKLIEFTKNSKDINEFQKQVEYVGVRYLEEAMIIILRAKSSEYNYSLNPGVIENLQPLFDENNKKLAERYGKIEKLTKGMLYSYGVVEFKFLRKTICKYMKEIITEDELNDLYFKRLSLNLFVQHYNINWVNTNQIETFFTYLDGEEADVGDIAEEQKSRGLIYKKFTEKEILNREEYLWDDRTKKLYEYIKNKNNNIWEYKFKKIVKRNEIGEDILGELVSLCYFEDEIEIQNFMNLFTEWYNNSPQYILGGYSPCGFKESMSKGRGILTS